MNGKTAHQARVDHDYGIVFQDAVLYDWRTVQRNVALPLELLGWDRAKRKERVREMLELVELTGFESSRPWQLSGGMQQRVSIARALSFDPALLLMDEPFGALDEMTRERLNMELLRIWEKSGSTVVFVTHSIPEAVFLSTRVVVMSARPGRIAATIDVDLPQPADGETREDARFFELVTAVREALAAGHGDDAAAAPPRWRSSSEQRPSSSRSRPASRGRSATRLRDWVPAIVVFLVGIGLWQGLTTLFDVQTFLLPKPSDIAQAFWDDKGTLWDYGLYTFKEALGGFALGSGLGILFALFLRALPDGRARADPVRGRGERGADHRLRADHEQLVRAPEPLLEDGDRGRPLLLPRDGEHAARADLGQPARDRADALVRGREHRGLPAGADPDVAAVHVHGLKVAAVLSMIGAIVGEYFGGPTNALGVSILNDTQLFNFPRAWAGIALASAFGIAFYAAVALVERLTTSWHPSTTRLSRRVTEVQNANHAADGVARNPRRAN